MTTTAPAGIDIYQARLYVTPRLWRFLLTEDGNAWQKGNLTAHRWIRWIVPRMFAQRILDEAFHV